MNRNPLANIAGNASLRVNENTASYALLDKNIYASGSLSIWDMDTLLPNVIILGLVNFAVDRDRIRVHSKSFCIPLCNAAWDETRARDYDVRVIRVTQPVVCNFWEHARRESESFMIPTDELERHGMRITKVYIPLEIRLLYSVHFVQWFVVVLIASAYISSYSLSTQKSGAGKGGT